MNKAIGKKVRISFLDMNENLLKIAEGVATNGSINIDGASAVRRTCQLNFISTQLKAIDYFQVYKTKFLLEIDMGSGYKKYGVYLLTSFSSSVSVNNFTFNISGKDKMCLLNGENGGSFPFSIDVGNMEKIDYNYERLTTFEYEPGKYYIQTFSEENSSEVTGYELDYSPYATADQIYFKQVASLQTIPLTIKEIINNVLTVYGKEYAHNIFIYDLDIQGLELLEYRGSEPLYLYRNKNTGKVDKIDLVNPFDDPFDFYPLSPLPDYNPEGTAKEIEGCYVIQIQYGDILGYRDTDLVYAGNLTANINENVVSILDKIKNMLGNYEYFYNEEGHFVFQKRKDYIGNQFDTISIDGLGMEYQSTSLKIDSPFELNEIVSIGQNPQFQNIKNDFSIWGTRSGSSGNLPIHSRVAIHKKPDKYTTYFGKEFKINSNKSEILYDKINAENAINEEAQMARGQCEQIYLTNLLTSYNSSTVHEYFSTFITNLQDETAYGSRAFYLGMAWVDAVNEIYRALLQYNIENNSKSKEEILFNFLKAMFSSKLLKEAIRDCRSYTTAEEAQEDFNGFIKALISETFIGLGSTGVEGEIIDNDDNIFTIVYPKNNGPYTGVFTDLLFNQLTKDSWAIYEQQEFDIILDMLNFYIDNFTDDWFNKFTNALGVGFVSGFKDIDPNKAITYKHQLVQQEGQNYVGTLYHQLYGWQENETDGTILLQSGESKSKIIKEIISQSKESINTIQENFKGLYNKSTIYVSDWREILYQMAKDYYDNGTKLDFWQKINQYNDNQYLNWKTGYEAFYEDILGFWRQLYFDPLYESLDYELPPGYTLDNYFWGESDSRNGWHKDVFQNPSGLNFWIDFIEPQGELSAYSIDSIGVKGKYENNSQVKSIATKKTPPIKVLTELEWQLLPPNPDPSYTYILMGGILSNAYTISSQGISALEKTQNHLFNHTYLQESINFSIIPREDLKVNSRVKLNMINVKGDYTISKITIPLAYNGMMSITLTKIPPTLTTEIITKEFE